VLTLNNFYRALFILLAFGVSPVHSTELISIDRDNIIVCPVDGDSDLESDFSSSNCQLKSIYDINPQNQALWVKAVINVPHKNLSHQYPLALYLLGKTSSEVFFNGVSLGKNGTPAFDGRNEFVGIMDARFYVPPELIKQGDNEVVLFLSAHHGFLKLRVPIHFIGLGEYTDTLSFFQSNIRISLGLFGALCLSALYFLVLSLRSKQRSKYIPFCLMAFISLSQLLVEISRGLFNYTYPVHDLRLMIIVLLSAGFGLCLLTFTLNKFTQKHYRLWLFIAVTLMAFAIIFMQGFDRKTAAAILIPSLIATIVVANKYRQKHSRELLGYLSVFVVFTVTIILTFNVFHDMLFYYIITGMMTFLFVTQANELINEQARRKEEELQVSKLQFKLDQNQQKQTPSKLKINSAGKTELLATDTILYCKAAGDYVEIHLDNQQQSLYSGSLKSIENLLPTTFLKVHRSYVVNLDVISSVKNSKSAGSTSATSSGFLVLNSGQEIPVSRRILPMVRGVIGDRFNNNDVQ